MAGRINPASMYLRRNAIFLLVISLLNGHVGYTQHRWSLMDSLFPGLPGSIHVYRSDASLSGRPSIAWYVEADLKDRSLSFDTDTTVGRRLTPSGFYQKNKNPLVVVNGTFFSFATNQNLNMMVKNGRIVAHNITSIRGKGRDSLLFYKVSRSAIGIDRERMADVAWILTDTARSYPLAFQQTPITRTDGLPTISPTDSLWLKGEKWKVRTAIGGGPALVHDGKVRITNNEERMFYGKAREDLHPRTAMGYTHDNKLIIMVVEGRRTGVAEGASLSELAVLFTELRAKEALNLDGGGSSCLLVMGRETIKPSDKEGQRPVPGVFIIR
jgi:exopolysaccharide biosynthesis protein